jgi:hypothetical protein
MSSLGFGCCQVPLTFSFANRFNFGRIPTRRILHIPAGKSAAALAGKNLR